MGLDGKGAVLVIPGAGVYNARAFGKARSRRTGAVRPCPGATAIPRRGRSRQMAECPVCGAEIELAADAVVGELMECPDCGTELEVLEVDPPELGEAPETEEDWGQ